jgi:hypothetical protein
VADPTTSLNFRSVNSLMMELSILHLCQPILIQPLTLPSVAALPATLTITSTLNLSGSSTVPALTFLGTQLVIMDGNNTEVITVISVLSPTQFTANTLYPHAAGIMVEGAPFPSQAQTDPLLTQTEVLGYIARAQNDLLVECPCIMELFQQSISPGAIYNSVPPTSIELNRLASSAIVIDIVSLTRTADVVTAVSISPHGLIPNQSFSILTSPADPTFIGAFTIATTPTPTTFTYPQYSANAITSVTGITAGVWTRAYEVSQQELSCQNPSWRTSHITSIQSWFEDRTGLYGYGVNGVPAIGFPVQLLCAVRDTDTLALTDKFLVGDIFLHLVKYQALRYIWSKDGEVRDASRAAYCKMRFERGVASIRRWLEWSGMRGAMTTADTMAGGK